MANLKPIVRLGMIGEWVEGDCACPDPIGLAPKIRWAAQDGPGEQDCACPSTNLPPSPRQAPLAGPHGRSSPLYRAPLPDRHEIVFAPSPSGRIAVLNAPARRILDAFAVPRHLPQVTDALPDLDPGDVSNVAAQLAHLELLQSAGQVAAPCQASPQVLTAWLHVTNRCNLQCAYCYVARGQQDMDEPTGLAAVEGVFRSAARHGFRAVKLKYAGGEPSLNFSLVRSLHARAKALSEHKGLTLQEVMLSNGLVLPDTTLLALRDMGIKLAVSLDGIGPVHDSLRGQGTFRRVAQTVDRAIALGLKPHISITVTARNADGLADVVAYVLDRDLAFNLNFYRETSCVAPSLDLGVENHHLIASLRRVLLVIQARLPRRSIIGCLLDRVNLGYPHSRPCGVGQSYAVIDQRGCISRCHMEIENSLEPNQRNPSILSKNFQAELALLAPALSGLGTIWEDDVVTAIGSTSNGWRNLEVDAKQGCRACIWRYWCAGGCPLLTQRLAGRDDVPSPYCEVYRTLFPELLHLEGLRLLKWGTPVA
jgi:uncharacterized protein